MIVRVLLLLIFLSTSVWAQGKPTLVEMNKDLRILNLQLRVKQLEYHDLRDRRDGLIAQVERVDLDYNKTLNARNRLQQKIQKLSKAIAPKELIPDGTDDE